MSYQFYLSFFFSVLEFVQPFCFTVTFNRLCLTLKKLSIVNINLNEWLASFLNHMPLLFSRSFNFVNSWIKQKFFFIILIRRYNIDQWKHTKEMVLINIFLRVYLIMWIDAEIKLLCMVWEWRGRRDIGGGSCYPTGPIKLHPLNHF